MKKRISQNGQLVIEAILLMIVLTSFTLMIQAYFRKNEVVSKFVDGPWVHLSGMIQNGVWAPPEEGQFQHPNNLNRMRTLSGFSK